MARKSFTLHKNTTNVVEYRPSSIPASAAYYGTYIKYPSGSSGASVGTTPIIIDYPGGTSAQYATLADDDTRLKSEGLLLPPILSNPARSGELLPYISFFEVNVLDYTEIELLWDAPLIDLASVSNRDLVVATEILINYSEEGEPQTVSDGSILIRSNTATSYYHQVPSGRWAYYTLFVKFESLNGDLYYEPAARIGVITPVDYGSIDELYRRIPEYYRLLDGNLDAGDGGPLYRYLSIFGYELDKLKTIIDYLMIMKDPQIANSEILDVISQDLGIGLRVHELGAARLRTLINIIGFLRRSEGTKSALELAMQAITGSDVVVDESNHKIKVYAQRVNLLKDPDLAVLIAGSFDAGFAETTSFKAEVDGGSIKQVNSTTYSFTAPDGDGLVDGTTGEILTPESRQFLGGTPSLTGNTGVAADQQPIWIYYEDLTSGGSAYILQSSSDYIQVKTGDVLYFSMQENPLSGKQDEILRVDLIHTEGTEIDPLYVPIASATSSVQIGGIKYWVLIVKDGYPSYVGTYIYVRTTSTADASSYFKKMLLERAIGGPYFDGNTKFGGWLVDAYQENPVLISDYRWFNPDNPNSSSPKENLGTDTYSIYNSNYGKTRYIVDRLLKNYLPVTDLTTDTSLANPIYPDSVIANPKWEVTFNHIYGVND